MTAAQPVSKAAETQVTMTKMNVTRFMNISFGQVRFMGQ
jgi:hypothetical protein